jgi:hypothetical protein
MYRKQSTIRCRHKCKKCIMHFVFCACMYKFQGCMSETKSSLVCRQKCKTNVSCILVFVHACINVRCWWDLFSSSIHAQCARHSKESCICSHVCMHKDGWFVLFSPQNVLNCEPRCQNCKNMHVFVCNTSRFCFCADTDTYSTGCTVHQRICMRRSASLHAMYMCCETSHMTCR